MRKLKYAFIGIISAVMVLLPVSAAMATGTSDVSGAVIGEADISDVVNGEAGISAAAYDNAPSVFDGTGYANTTTEEGITITIGTDKAIYKEGEEVCYQIIITNNGRHTKIDKFSINYGNSEGLEPSGGAALPKDVPILDEGESYTIEGVLIGDVSKFPADTYVAPGTGLNNPDAIGSQGGDGTGEGQKGGGIATVIYVIVVVVVLIIIAIVVIFIFKKNGKKQSGNGSGIKGLIIFLAAASTFATIMISKTTDNIYAADDFDTVTIRPYLKFIYADHEVMIRSVIELHVYQKYIAIDSARQDNTKKISCHDPSIFKADGKYYVFGTHITAAVSEDLKTWTSIDATFRNALSRDVRTAIRAWNKDETAGNWFDYLWAPDIVYNPVLGKYCMYISANGDDWISNIVMVTSDSVEGPYDYAGTVVYGGFVEDTFAKTDAPQVMGTDKIPQEYLTNGVTNKKWGDKYPNCIDPCVFYDNDGKLWMSYGSWSGGIYILKLDEATGLRNYSVKYETNEHSDIYFGKKIAGGKYVSGEASYIQQIGNYYYLFISYGNLEAAGGYNMRVFKSDKPDGEYVDALGNDAFSDTYIFNYNTSKGVRLFGGYKWRTFVYGQVAQGHNSAFVDDDGRAYVVFHTRTTNGTEYHYIKVHQLFVNKEGWLVAAPYQTSGEALKKDGYSVSEVVGEYDVILHELDIDYKHLGVNKTKCMFLNADGSITGDFEGTWSLDDGTPYINLKIDGVNYSGVCLKMNVEGTNIETMVFTGLGDTNQLTIWGSKLFE